MTNAQKLLLLHFLDDYSGYLGRSGCNDMPQEILGGLSMQERTELWLDFTNWDLKANPDNLQIPYRKTEQVNDFEWVAYLYNVILRCGKSI